MLDANKGPLDTSVVRSIFREIMSGSRALQKVLKVAYLGPDNDFPPMADPPDGLRLRIAVERIGGIGPWAS